MKEFASDNLSGICPEVFEAIGKANLTHDYGYSFDQYTALARELMQKEFTQKIESYIVANGSGANILALKAMLQSYNSVICAKQTHINVHEVGGLEFVSGSKIISVDSPDAKLTVEAIKPCLNIVGDFNFSQPKVVVLSQPTELGTLYSKDELKTICDFAHQNGLYVYVDGARISNALAALNLNLHEMMEETKVDVFCFGGTKNGAMGAEMIVFLNLEFAKNFIYIQKQLMQMMSKSRFVACQMAALLKDGVHLKNAKHANDMAFYLASQLMKLGVVFTQKVESNAIFIKMDHDLYDRMQEKFYFYKNDETIYEVRLVTSFDTKKEEIDEFVRELSSCLKIQ